MTNDHRSFDVTLVGDCNLDLVLYGLPETLSAERELLADSMAIRLGGSAAITAHNLAALGNSVGFICASADDSFGAFCMDGLAAAGVDTSQAVKLPSGSTGVSVLLQHARFRRILTYAGVTHSLTYKDLDLAYLSQSRHFHMASYYLQQALTPDIPKILEQIKSRGLTISLDPNDDPGNTWNRSILEALKYLDILMPNEQEACRLADEPSLDKAIGALRNLVPLLVIKSGGNGASAYTRNREWRVPAYPVKVVDAVGAGDSFNAGFLHGYVRGWSIEKCLRYGIFAGAWSTTASGGTSAFSAQASRNAYHAAWNEFEIAQPGSVAKAGGR